MLRIEKLLNEPDSFFIYTQSCDNIEKVFERADFRILSGKKIEYGYGDIVKVLNDTDKIFYAEIFNKLLMRLALKPLNRRMNREVHVRF